MHRRVAYDLLPLGTLVGILLLYKMRMKKLKIIISILKAIITE